MNRADLIIYAGSVITCRGEGRPKTGEAMDDVGLINSGAVAVLDGNIIAVGPRSEIEESCTLNPGGTVIDGGPMVLMPGLVDSHTHPVYGGNRVEEFMMRARGATYQEIHAKGGGIGFTVEQTRKTKSDRLFEDALGILNRMLRHGTTTIEAKSGYGLNLDEEIRELEIITRLDGESNQDVVATFMGAHSLPQEYKDRREEYVDLVINEMMPAVRQKKLARFVDVFCEEGAFNLEETRRILKAARDMGFELKIHAEEFTSMGSAVMASSLGAVSADHLLRISDEDIDQIAKTNTIMTLMPGTLFFLDSGEYAPARRMIDRGGKVSLATDFNAGSCLGGSMQMAMSLGCIKMKMTPGEAINAATHNAAYALGMGSRVGAIEEGKQGDLILMNVDDYRLIPYHFGENLVNTVIKKGRVVVEG